MLWLPIACCWLSGRVTILSRCSIAHLIASRLLLETSHAFRYGEGTGHQDQQAETIGNQGICATCSTRDGDEQEEQTYQDYQRSHHHASPILAQNPIQQPGK
jgi:hypothetical protein